MSDGDTILCQDLYQVNVQKLTVDDNSKEKQNRLPSNENDDVTVEHEEPQFGMMNELFPEKTLMMVPLLEVKTFQHCYQKNGNIIQRQFPNQWIKKPNEKKSSS